jgi:hypothetical protein
VKVKDLPNDLVLVLTVSDFLTELPPVLVMADFLTRPSPVSGVGHSGTHLRRLSYYEDLRNSLNRNG